jgi:hypothetical protein
MQGDFTVRLDAQPLLGAGQQVFLSPGPHTLSVVCVDPLSVGRTFAVANLSIVHNPTKGLSSAIRNAAVNVGDTVLPAVPNGRIYKCTTGGNTAAGEPAWPVVAGGAVADGTAVWTEQTTALEAGTFTEVAGGSYARPAVVGSLANFSGTQGAGTTIASSGTGGTISNNVLIPYPAPTANWGLIFGVMIMDALAAGNALLWGALTTPKQVNNGDAAPAFPAATIQIQIDN